MAVRGIRGATTVEDASNGRVRDAVEELLARVVAANGVALEDIASATFTLTDDLRGANPAAAARSSGWSFVPLSMVREHASDVPLERCIRVLVLWNTDRPQSEIRHAYLRGAVSLRPDLADGRADR